MTISHPQFPRPSRVEVVEAGYTGDLRLVRAALSSTDGEVRAAALGASLRLGELRTDIVTSYLTDVSSAVRRRATELSTRVEATPALLRGLCAVLLDVDQVAEVGAFALGEVGSSHPDLVTSEVADALVATASDHPDPLCREAAVASLGALGLGLDTILSAMGDKATVRRRAVIALAPFDGPEVVEAIESALSDRDWQVRQAAEDLAGVRPTSDEND